MGNKHTKCPVSLPVMTSSIEVFKMLNLTLTFSPLPPHTRPLLLAPCSDDDSEELMPSSDEESDAESLDLEAESDSDDRCRFPLLGKIAC